MAKPPGAHMSDTATVPRRALPAALAPTFSVRILEGPDAGRVFRVDGRRTSRVLIGQSPACEIRLADAAASRRHAALELTDTGLRIVDLGSTNGTIVNGLAVVEAFIGGGETIRVGDTALRVDDARMEGAPELAVGSSFGNVVGASPEMRRLYPLCEKLAASSVPLVIEGETGTGKEILAEAIHEAGPRSGGPFVVFDCTAVPPSLLESELFGHERGAFTGAIASRKGRFEQAHGGTLLIDEIGDLDLALQPKLLRAIERSEVCALGSDRWVRVDVRVIATTRRDLDREVQVGRFRDDLFFRLAVTRIELPPLRKRQGDVALLTRHFWTQLGGQGAPPDHVVQRFEEYAWPGNVRELHNAVAHRLAMGEHAALPGRTGGPPGADFIDAVVALGLPLVRGRQRVVEEYERRYVEHVLQQHEGNVRRAARASGLARRYFQLLKARQANKT